MPDQKFGSELESRDLEPEVNSEQEMNTKTESDTPQPESFTEEPEQTTSVQEDFSQPLPTPETKNELIEEQSPKTHFSSSPALGKEELMPSDWAEQDGSIEQEFPKESSQILEEENFIISEPEKNIIEDKALEKDLQPSQQEQSTTPQKPVAKEESISESLDTQLEKTTRLLEELKHGEVPLEDVLVHLEHGIEQCRQLLEQKRFLDAKYKYNELCKIFERTELEEPERTKWFGVLRKTYDRILEAEKF